MTAKPFSPTELRVTRLTRAVDTLLEACRRGDVSADVDELLALHAICVDHGAYEASTALREHLAALCGSVR